MTFFVLTLSTITINHWLILSAGLFAIGIYGVMTRRNAVGILLSIEILLNSAIVNFLVFNRYIAPGAVDGAIQSLFIIAVAAAEAVAALAIFVAMFTHHRSLDVTEATLGVREEEEGGGS